MPIKRFLIDTRGPDYSSPTFEEEVDTTEVRDLIIYGGEFHFQFPYLSLNNTMSMSSSNMTPME